MKATKLIAMIAFAGFGLCAEVALAQGNDQTQSTPPPPVAEEPAATTGEEPQPYNETVTIDNGATEAAATPSDNGIGEQAERKEKLRVYSGKHDGNNVISDPR